MILNTKAITILIGLKKNPFRRQCGHVVNHPESHLHLYLLFFYHTSIFWTPSRGDAYCNLSMRSVVYEHFIGTGTTLDTDIFTLMPPPVSHVYEGHVKREIS